jgi:hypothetical protein
MTSRSPDGKRARNAFGPVPEALMRTHELDGSESGVLRDRGGRGADVAAVELDRVHDERRDLGAGPPDLPNRRRAGSPRRTRRSTHRRTHRRAASSRGRLAVASMSRGIDQPAPTVDANQPVAGPQVAALPRRWFAGVGRGKPAREAFEVGDLDRDRPRDRKSQERASMSGWSIPLRKQPRSWESHGRTDTTSSRAASSCT